MKYLTEIPYPTMMDEKTLQGLREVNEILEKYNTQDYNFDPPITDLLPTYAHLFNEAATTALQAPRARSLVRQIPGTMDIEQVAFLSLLATGEEEIPLRAEELVKAINIYADLGYIVNFLAPLAYIRLFNETPNVKTPFAVYTWPNMTPAGFAAVERDGYPFFNRKPV